MNKEKNKHSDIENDMDKQMNRPNPADDNFVLYPSKVPVNSR
jgi:hypothetical protein